MNRVFRHDLFWPGVLVLVGAWLLLANLGLLDWIRSDVVWPVVLIALGIWLIVRRRA